jgi:hypothetical protein
MAKFIQVTTYFFIAKRFYFGTSRVPWVLQKCCNQKKTPWKYWAQWTFRRLKNAKIQTKTHEMDVLDTLDDETLQSHSMDALDRLDAIDRMDR